MMKKTFWAISLLVALLCSLTGCGSSEDASLLNADPQTRSAVSEQLTYSKSMDLSYAEGFAVDYYKEGGSLITVFDGRRYLVTDSAPKDLADDITVLSSPVTDVYVAGTACMDMFRACDAMDTVRFSSQRESDWKIAEAATAMKAGDILFAGKYSAPDYELLTSTGCGLAVENNMIYHSPTVIEKLEELGIPVFIDGASREKTPQARMEWVKIYGLLTGHEADAASAFKGQEKEFLALENAADDDATGDVPTVAYFSLKSNETVTVRRATDYIPYMIDLAGGQYAFPDLGKDDTESSRSTETISMEEFYTTAKDADYFVYNSTIEGEKTSIAQLLKDAPVLKDCKAVKEGHVYCTTADLYQNSMSQGTFVRDIYDMLRGNDGDMTYLFRLN